MKTVKEVDQIFDALSFSQVTEHLVSLENSLGHRLSQDIFAQRNSPPFNRVAMDGIAIWLERGQILEPKYRVATVSAAGAPQAKLLNQNECIEVMTGAVLPSGCNTVVPYEHLEIVDNFAMIRESSVKSGDNVHHEGADYCRGDLLLSKGDFLNSTKIAMIASEGIKEVLVSSKIRTIIVATGSELVLPGERALPHQIYASNLFALKSELEAHGHLVCDTRLIQDNEKELREELAALIELYDLIILSGGVSKGKFDFVPTILAELGVEKIIHKVKQKPGKPLFVGVVKNKKVVVGLPGNPVSSLVNLRRYVIPLLARVEGQRAHSKLIKLNEDIYHKNDFTLFLPVSQHQQEAYLVVNNGSGDFYSLTKSSGFIELTFSDEKKKFSSGELVPFFSWGHL